MPCFSASTARSATQFPQHGNRAKTAAAKRNVDDIRLPSYALKKESSFNPCTNTFYNQGVALKGSRKNRYREEHKVIPSRELERLKSAAKVVTIEERLDALMKREQEAKRLEIEAEQTKQRFKEIDDARKKAEAEGLKDRGSDKVADNAKTLERAFLAKQEQEEEVKKANRIILDAKCHAVRDAQVQEKTELQRELRNDEKRLERLVIESALKGLQEEDEKVNRQYEMKQKYAQDIKKQLHDRDNLRFLEAERVDEEAAMIQKAHAAFVRDEERRMKEAHERRRKYSEDLSKVVEMCTQFRKILWQQERECEMRVAAYLKDREERLRELQKQKDLAKEEFERKQQRIYSLAEKILQSKTDRDEMSYLRDQEKNEREYRRKEREAALRKKQIEREMTQARERQMQENKYRQALQIARAEQDFNTLIDRLKQEQKKEEQEQAERERRRQIYRSDIVQQMGNNEMERRRLKELEMNQAMAWRKSERQRDDNIRAVINAKLTAMKEACLPEKYIKDVKKQLSRITGSSLD